MVFLCRLHRQETNRGAGWGAPHGDPTWFDFEKQLYRDLTEYSHRRNGGVSWEKEAKLCKENGVSGLGTRERWRERVPQNLLGVVGAKIRGKNIGKGKKKRQLWVHNPRMKGWM